MQSGSPIKPNTKRGTVTYISTNIASVEEAVAKAKIRLNIQPGKNLILWSYTTKKTHMMWRRSFIIQFNVYAFSSLLLRPSYRLWQELWIRMLAEFRK